MSILKVKLFLFGSVMLLLTKVTVGKDLGVVGETFVIKEPDLLKVIMNKLHTMNSTGELAQHQQLVQNKIKKRILEPKANNLPETIKQREFYYDPTITVQEDLSDSKGHVFKVKGEQINPLDFYSFRAAWLFFDGNSEQQKIFALARAKQQKIKLILTAGRPLDLMQEWQQPVYFDQFGWFAAKFKITQVPALVEQHGKKLKIIEIDISKWKK
jgi:conjugal transfer pilus assembly protein TraW